MKTHPTLDNEISETPKFKSRKDYLDFLKAIENDSSDDAPALRGFIAKLHYYQAMPSLNAIDLHYACQRHCSTFSEDDISKYLLKLFDIGFLLYADNLPTKVLENELLASVSKKPCSYYLNVDFYKKDCFAGSVPNVAHANEIYKDSDAKKNVRKGDI